MKLTSLLLTFACLQVTARSTGQTVTLNLDKAPVQKVFKAVSRQTGKSFVYNEGSFANFSPITIKVKNATIQDVLDFCLKGQPYSYAFDGNLIVIRRKESTDVPTQKNATKEKSSFLPFRGRILNEIGLPIAGVSIIEKGTSNGVTSAEDGYFTIEVKNNDAVLIITNVGYQPTEISIKGKNNPTILLQPNVQKIEEVVVIGYGQQQRRDVTSSISSVKGNEIATIPVARLDQALQGKIPGLTVSTNDASPGGDVTMRIRGYSTAAQQGDNAPLFVIDGVPTKEGIKFLNPGDIETIDVLKDAAAASIYGIQAANGVIVITTKKGSRGKSDFSISAYTGWGEAWRQDIAVLNPREQATYNNMLYDVWNTRPDGTKIQPGEQGYVIPNPIYANPDSLPVKGTDWQKEIFRPALMTDLHLSYRGGIEKTQFSISGGFRTQEGVIINTNLKRYTLKANLDHYINSFMRFGLTFNLGQTERSGVYNNVDFNSVTFSALGFSGLYPVRTADGLYGAPPVGPNEYFGDAKHPVAQAELADLKYKDQGLNASSFFELQILKGLRFRSTIGLGLIDGSNKEFNQPPIQNIQNVREPNTSTLVMVNRQSKNLNWDNYITFDRSIKNHKLTWVLGSSAQRSSKQFSNVRQEGFTDTDPSRRYFGFGDPNKIATVSNSGERSLLSYFTRLNYSFKNKYLLQAVVRRDGASVFAPENRWGTFPAFSAGWNVAEESFFNKIGFINLLKFRGSWGLSGNFNLGDDFLIYNRLVTGSNYNFGGVLVPGVRPSQLGERNISWESNEQTDFGLDLGLLQNKFVLELDYYRKLTRDMLIRSAIPATGGGALAPPRNIGKIENSGLEFMATWNERLGKDFNFSISVNGATLHNKVLDLGDEKFILPIQRTNFGINDEITRAVLGSSISEYYGYLFDGIYQNQHEIDNGPKHDRANVVRPGDIRWKDINGPDGVPDGIISDYDRATLGSVIPKFTYGLTLNFYYKNFDFNTLLQGASGGKIFSLVYRNLVDHANGRTRLKDALDYWHGEGTSYNNPRIAFDDPAGNWRISDRYVFDASYMRIRNVQLGYTANSKNFLQKWNITKLRVYLGVQNLLTQTKYFGFDPEVGQNANQTNGNQDLQMGIDKGIYPLQRSYLIGLELNF